MLLQQPKPLNEKVSKLVGLDGFAYYFSREGSNGRVLLPCQWVKPSQGPTGIANR